MNSSRHWMLLILVLVYYSGQSQNPQDKAIWKYMHMLSADELYNQTTVQTRIQSAAIPSAPVESLAEFEQMSGAFVSYPWGITLDMISELSKKDTVYFVLNNTSDESAIKERYKTSINLTRCKFILAAHDSYWIRDYGPMFTAGKDSIAITDFSYNRNRPQDDKMPQLLASYYRFPYYFMNIIQTGGNYMTDGYGVAAASQLVYNENTITKEQVCQQMKDYLGIQTYHVLADPNNTYIDHIDCWGKFLDVDKVLIRSVPITHPQYSKIEQVADYFKTQKSSWGTNYQIIRVNTPNNEPYTNSFILNKKVYVPIMGTEWDNPALEVYRKALPGYEVFGYKGDWYSTDAIHCRVHEMADRHMVRIKHTPIRGAQGNKTLFSIEATIKAYSGKPLNSDSLLVYYKVNFGQWNTVKLSHSTENTYIAQLPLFEKDQTIEYYIYATDQTGKRATQPLVGAIAPYVFSTGDIFTESQLLQRETEIKIYPNPVSDWLSITTDENFQDENLSIEIYSGNGQLLKRFSKLNTGNTLIDCRNLATGIYHLRVSTSSRCETFKVIKK